MATCYAVLWIPTIAHRSIVGITPFKQKIERNISDIEGNIFKIEVSLRGKDIDVSIVDPDSSKSLLVNLFYIDDSRNGMVEYSYEETSIKKEGSDGFEFSSKNFPEAVYHIIKEFYHIHEFHDPECDSSLAPYISNEKVDIHNNDNLALQHYLKCYERVLSNMVEAARYGLQMIREKQRENKGSEIKAYNSYARMSILAKGYEAYLNALYDSVYNTQCRMHCNMLGGMQDVMQKEDTSQNEPQNKRKEILKEMRRRAFNIENAIKYFAALDYEFYINVQQHNTIKIINHTVENANKNMDATLNSSKLAIEATSAENQRTIKEIANSSRSSIKWAVISITVGFVFSLAATLYSSYLSRMSSIELQDTKTELIKHIDCIQNKLGSGSVE